MKKEIQAEWVFKYYKLPKQKVVEPGGRLGKHDYCEREIVKGRDSPVTR